MTEDRHREAGEHEAEGQSLLGQDTAGRDRALGGAAHDGVDIGVIPHVERTRRTCADGNAEDGDQAENGIDVTRRQHQAGKGGEDHERHDPRLQKLEIIARTGLRQAKIAVFSKSLVIVDYRHHSVLIKLTDRRRRSLRRLENRHLT